MITRMPWGKYKDLPLDQVEPSYLLWVLEHMERAEREPDLIEAVAHAFVDQLRRNPHLTAALRSPGTPAPPSPDPGPTTTTIYMLDRHMLSAEDLARLTDMVETGYKRLAMNAHPDRGGSSAAMSALNRVRDLFNKAFGGKS